MDTGPVESVRPATDGDRPFLAEVLALAADWRAGSRPRPVAEIMATPLLAHYVDGWPADGEAGFVALGTGPVGAAWWRWFPRDDQGFGFVDEETPELSVAVVASARGRGHGARLLGALMAEARRRGVARLSLSVEADNPAVHLYRRLGFIAVGGADEALTMLASLDR